MKDISYTELMGANVLERLKYHGKNVRIWSLAKIINPECAVIGDECRILDFAFIDAKESFVLGNHSIICWHSVIEGHANIRIGNRCFVGPGVKILSSTYDFNGYFTNEHLPEGTHATIYGDVTIQDDVYIGANSVIMPGITIGEGAVIGANAFVNKDVEPWGIYVGSPARRVSTRQKPDADKWAVINQMNWDLPE